VALQQADDFRQGLPRGRVVGEGRGTGFPPPVGLGPEEAHRFPVRQRVHPEDAPAPLGPLPRRQEDGGGGGEFPRQAPDRLVGHVGVVQHPEEGGLQAAGQGLHRLPFGRPGEGEEVPPAQDGGEDLQRAVGVQAPVQVGGAVGPEDAAGEAARQPLGGQGGQRALADAAGAGEDDEPLPLPQGAEESGQEPFAAGRVAGDVVAVEAELGVGGDAVEGRALYHRFAPSPRRGQGLVGPLPQEDGEVPFLLRQGGPGGLKGLPNGPPGAQRGVEGAQELPGGLYGDGLPEADDGARARLPQEVARQAVAVASGGLAGGEDEEAGADAPAEEVGQVAGREGGLQPVLVLQRQRAAAFGGPVAVKVEDVPPLLEAGPELVRGGGTDEAQVDGGADGRQALRQGARLGDVGEFPAVQRAGDEGEDAEGRGFGPRARRAHGHLHPVSGDQDRPQDVPADGDGAFSCH
jgi:hypothetical protein